MCFVTCPFIPLSTSSPACPPLFPFLLAFHLHTLLLSISGLPHFSPAPAYSLLPFVTQLHHIPLSLLSRAHSSPFLIPNPHPSPPAYPPSRPLRPTPCPSLTVPIPEHKISLTEPLCDLVAAALIENLLMALWNLRTHYFGSSFLHCDFPIPVCSSFII